MGKKRCIAENLIYTMFLFEEDDDAIDYTAEACGVDVREVRDLYQAHYPQVKKASQRLEKIYDDILEPPKTDKCVAQIAVEQRMRGLKDYNYEEIADVCDLYDVAEARHILWGYEDDVASAVKSMRGVIQRTVSRIAGGDP